LLGGVSAWLGVRPRKSSRADKHPPAKP